MASDEHALAQRHANLINPAPGAEPTIFKTHTPTHTPT